MQTGVAEWLAPGVRRILAPNPSRMTGPGTNSYLLGRGGGLVLVDPGPLNGAHVAALMASLGPDEHVAQIIVTHAHLDHSAAAPRLAALTKAPILAFGDATAGRSATMRRLADAGLQGGGEGVDTAFRPDRTLADGETIEVGESRLRTLHTPGHMGGHICLAFGNILLSGDHAMGWASSLVSPPDGDMGAYVASLARLAGTAWALMLPGHGAAVTEVASRLAALRDHRKARESAILAALTQAPSSADALTTRIYTDIPTTLIAAARRNVLAHLIDLTERNLIETPGLPAPDAVFHHRGRNG